MASAWRCRRLDLLDRSQVTDRARATHEHRQHRQLGGVHTPQRIGASQSAQQVYGGRVQSIRYASCLSVRHTPLPGADENDPAEHSMGGGHGGRCYHGPPMIFVDYLGPTERLPQASEVVKGEVGAAMRVLPDQVAVRRIVTDDDRDEVELWVELSTDEQLYRLGRQLAQRISAGLRPDGLGPQVWVMYRVVPLSNAFLNGEARG